MNLNNFWKTVSGVGFQIFWINQRVKFVKYALMKCQNVITGIIRQVVNTWGDDGIGDMPADSMASGMRVQPRIIDDIDMTVELRRGVKSSRMKIYGPARAHLLSFFRPDRRRGRSRPYPIGTVLPVRV